ncbi:MAG: hypothetical protein J2P48_03785 [Alphaproteobacteria bacterium]|nr:hypothetical protein [Alphaproteobacteria bacterium]
MSQITPDPIMRIAIGFMAAKHLFVANEIGLFTGLAQGPASFTNLPQYATSRGAPRASAPMRW